MRQTPHHLRNKLDGILIVQKRLKITRLYLHHQVKQEDPLIDSLGGTCRPPPKSPSPLKIFLQINKIIDSLSHQLQTKGRELNEFREKHNIRLMGEEDQKTTSKESTEGSGGKASSAGVLVS